MSIPVKNIILAILTLSITSIQLSAQVDDYQDVSKSLDKINHMIIDMKFREAIEQGKKLVKRHPKNPDVYLALGLGYYNLSNHPDSAVYYLKKGLEFLNDDEQMEETGINLQLSLAKSLQMMLNPERALEIYKKLLLRLSFDQNELISEINREMQTCENARILISNPIAFKIVNLGDNVNSKYDDHSPLVSIKGDVIYFTSRRPGDGRSMQYDDQYPEKIWLSKLQDSVWENAENIKSFFRKNEHESAVSLSPDGKNMFLFKNDPDGKNLYVSNLVNNEWQPPKRLSYNINSYSDETHCSISADGSTLFFTSNMPGGIGGMDIYYSKKDINGNWGDPHNLGKTINTPYDEETPMIYMDGKTLYFASEGHNSMGQFDIFYSQMNPDSTWSTPINMGFPINTPGDDMFFVPTIDRKKAFYATKKFSSNRGGLDIYLIEFQQDFTGKLSVIEGKVKEGDDYKVVRLLVTRTEDMQLVGDYRPDPATGEYTLFLETGYRYQIKEIRQHIEEAIVGEIDVPDNMSYLPKKQTLSMISDVPMEPPLIKAQEQKNTTQSIETIESKQQLEKSLNQDLVSTTETQKKVSKPEPTKVEIVSSHPITEIQQTQTPQQSLITSGFTIQLLALRRQPLQDYSIFDALDKTKITEHICTDGFNRYTYGVFGTKTECLIEKKKIQSNDQFKDAFIRSLQEIHLMRLPNNQ